MSKARIQSASRLEDEARQVSSKVCHTPSENLLTILGTIISVLLGTKYIQGDGNFHQQQKQTAPNALQNPSLVGDRGFWPSEKIFTEYITTRGAAVDDDQKKVCVLDSLCHSKSNVPAGDEKLQYPSVESDSASGGGAVGRHWRLRCLLPPRHDPAMGSYRFPQGGEVCI